MDEKTPLRSQANKPGYITDCVGSFFSACCAQICQGIQDTEEADARQDFSTAKIEHERGHFMSSIHHAQTGRAKEYEANETETVVNALKKNKSKTTQCGQRGQVAGETVGGVICCFLLCCKSILDVVEACTKDEAKNEYDYSNNEFPSRY